VIPLEMVAGTPIPDARCGGDVPVPPYATRYARKLK
jgi:hypothetical protein